MIVLLLHRLFQFTHPQGVRSDSVLVQVSLDVSIHAPARGAIELVIEWAQKQRFNSRTRKGCDVNDKNVTTHKEVSIHAPARGAMQKMSGNKSSAGFNSRTRKGCDARDLC